MHVNNSRTAQILAQELLSQAVRNEPKITEDLQTIAGKVSAEMIGLENKFKSAESLIRKLLLLAEKDKTDQIFEQKLVKHSRNNNDTLRYTFILQNAGYAENFSDIVTKLRFKGYKIPQNRIWNAWKNAGTFRDTGYRGINITIISSQNQKFEIQFHTEESYRFKNETHRLYAELRDLETSVERRKEIIKKNASIGTKY